MPSNEILYVVGSLDIGGSERHLVLITPNLKPLGWRPVIYCMTHRGILAEHLEQQGVEIIGPPFITRSESKSVKLLALIASAFKLLGTMLRRQPGIAHFFLPMAYLVGAPLAILARVPVCVMSRRSLNIYQKNHPFLRRIELALHPRMNALLGNSRAVVTQLERENNGEAVVQLIYNGIKIAPNDRAPGKTPGDGASLVLIIVANLIAYKGHRDLFRALAMIAPRLPNGWELLCVGRDDGIRKDLVILADELGLRQHIRLLGQRTDIAELLHTADIGILCSHEEGFSNAILEGMAAGLPMIVTDVGGNAEAVVDGVTGLVVPAHDPIALSKALLALVQDPTRREKMGRAARQRAEVQFSLTHCVKQYDEFYHGLQNREPPLR